MFNKGEVEMTYQIMDVKDWDYSGGLVVGTGYITSGGVVRAVQQLMWAMGHATGAFDGEYGPNTESAIKAYQASVGLSQDGIVGPATWGKLWTHVTLDSDSPTYPRGLEMDNYTFTGTYDSNLRADRIVGFQQSMDSGTCHYWWGYIDANDDIMYCMDNSLNSGMNYEFSAVCYIDDAGDQG